MRLVRRYHYFSKVIAFNLVVAIVSFSIPMAALDGDLSPRPDKGKAVNLGVQSMSGAFDPQIESSGKLAVALMEDFSQSGMDPEKFFKGGQPAKNYFSYRGGHAYRMFKDHAVEITPGDENKGPLARVYVFPVYYDRSLNYAYLAQNKNGEWGAEVHTPEEFSADCLQWMFLEPGVPELKARLAVENGSFEASLFFVDDSDAAVAVAKDFLARCGIPAMAAQIDLLIRERRLLLSERPAELYMDAVLVTESADVNARAASILTEIFAMNSQDFDRLRGVFGEYLRSPQAFALGTASPELLVYAATVEKDLSGTAGNEGNMRFGKEAYSYMFYVDDRTEDDAGEVLGDLKEAMIKIAEYDMPVELREQYELYKAWSTLDRKPQRMRGNTMVVDFKAISEAPARIRELEEKLGITDATRDVKRAEYEALFMAMPGIAQDNITMKDFYRGFTEKGFSRGGLLPTDRVHPNGLMEFNVNFLKLLSKYKEDFLGENGRILDIEVGNEIIDELQISDPKVLGEIYTSILYAIAIHTIRGHFPRLGDGTVIFNPDEFIAQRERGGKDYGYVNTLALWFYLVVMCDRAIDPEERLAHYMRTYDYAFKHLTSEEKVKLPRHLMVLCMHLRNRGVSPFFPPENVPYDGRYKIRETGVTAVDVDGVMKEAPKAVSNEGGTIGEEGKYPEKDMPVAVFDIISRAEAPLNLNAINENIGRYFPVRFISGIPRLVDILEDIGAISRTEDGKVRSVLVRSEEERIKLREILRDNGEALVNASKTGDMGRQIPEVNAIKIKIYEVTESKWPWIMVNSLDKAIRDRASGDRANKVRIAIETDWVPLGQQAGMQVLMQKLREMDLDGKVEVVMKEKGESAEDFAVRSKAEGVRPENIIVLASQGAIEDIFKEDPDFGKAFLAGVDASRLNDNCYIRIMEMLAIAIRMSSGQTMFRDHSKIDIAVDPNNPRIVKFMPKAEPFNWNTDVRDVYKAQLQALVAA